MAKQPNPYFTPCKSIWLSFYKSKTGEDYYFTGKDAMHITQLVKKIQAKLAGRSMEPTMDHVTNSLTQLLNSITDRWILENLEIAIVNSKFNVIFSKAIAASPLGVRDSVEEYLRNKNSQRAG